jgi:hypothetical protein
MKLPGDCLRAHEIQVDRPCNDQSSGEVPHEVPHRKGDLSRGSLREQSLKHEVYGRSLFLHFLSFT